jgi:hypothetical protein
MGAGGFGLWSIIGRRSKSRAVSGRLAVAEWMIKRGGAVLCSTVYACNHLRLLNIPEPRGAPMRRYLHVIALAMFLLTLLLDLVFWGAVPGLPDVGPKIARSAHAEAILASTYMLLGGYLDAAVASLNDLGASVMTSALGDSFARIIEDPSLAMDLILSSTFNSTHRWVKLLYWAPPILFVAYLVLWVLRPKSVKLIPTR